MKPRLTRTRILIGLAAVATVIAVVAAPQQPSEAVAVSTPLPKPARETRASPALVPAALPTRRGLGGQRGDLFSARSSAPRAPSVSTQAAAPPVPVAPPNPYRFAGTAVHDGRLHTYVTDGSRVYEVWKGADLERGYRVDSVTTAEVTLIYTALGSRHAIPVVSLLTAPAPVANQVAAAAR
jgi:hypothetical protein